MVKFLWIKVENTRPVELETTQIRNVNSLIHFLKNRFELSTPEHLLILKLAGNEIPSDAAVETLVSSFKDPLELISIDTTQQPSAPRYRPMNPNQASLPIEENQFQFLESPPFLGNVGQAANREYFKIPVKPFILVILLLGCIDSFALVIWVSPIYGAIFFLNLLGFWATLQKKALYLSYYAWVILQLTQGRLFLIIPEILHDAVYLLFFTAHYRPDEIALLGIDLIFKYLLYFFYFFCIRKLWSKLSTPPIRLDVEEPLISGN